MSPDIIRPNGPPTLAETIRIKRFISSRQRDIENIESALAEEENQIDECTKAISNLEISIPQGKNALKTHEENLTALIGIQSRLRGLISVENITLEQEDQSQGLYREMKNSADAPLNESLNPIDKQVNQLQKEVRNLQDKIRNMELELEGWQRSHRLSTTTSQNLVDSKENMEADMKDAQRLLSPILRVPSEVWVDIFGKYVQVEMEDYVLGDSMMPLGSVAITFSQVCRGWRNIVLQERNLWDIVATHPSIFWSPDKYHLFTTLISRSSSRITLVTNLSQTLSWLSNSGIKPDGKSEVIGKNYTAHILIKNKIPQLAQKMQSISFHHADSLVLSSLVPEYGEIFNTPTDFTSIISLSINQECPSICSWPGFSGRFPNIKTLRFHVQDIPSGFPIRSFLVSRLKELHLHRKSNEKLPSLSDIVQLPNLQTLGISFPCSDFLSKIEAPALSTLLFYGPVEPATVSLATGDETNTTITTLLKRITHILFEEWTASPGGAEAASCLRDVWKRMLLLERLTFSNSYVNGETLMSTIDPFRLPADDQLSFSSLASITLCHTTGITQAQCEELRSIGKTVHIYA